MGIKVYIAGPYSTGDPVLNVKAAIDAADFLASAGLYPYIPHLTMFWHLIHPHEISFWYEIDREFLLYCNCLLRLPGRSKGASEEVDLARANKIHVYYSAEHLVSELAL